MIDDIYFQVGARLNRFPQKMPLVDEYLRILQEIFTPEEAAIAIRLPAQPAPLTDLCERVGMGERELRAVLERMAEKGTVFSIEREGRTRYSVVPFVPGIAEFQLMRADGSARERTFAVLFEEFEKKMTSLMTPETMQQLGGMEGKPFARVIPVEEEARSVTEILPYEIASAFLERENFFAVAKCYCRHHADLMGRPCKVTNAPEFGCMSFGDVARFVVHRGFGKEVSREEARRILDGCEKAGLVHCTNNVSDMMTFICNCCGCCCGILRLLVKYRYPLALARSNFIVQAARDACSGCGDCMNVCQVHALALREGTVCLDVDRCIGCGLCCASCPTGCLSLVRRKEIVVPGRATDPFIGVLEDG